MADWSYNTSTWLRLRDHQLQVHPLCEWCLANEGRPTVANHVDHRTPINCGGDPFPLVGIGLASLCASCHSRKSARGPEAGAVRTSKPIKGCDVTGHPLDPNHPWNLE
jgi:5-methylcytosine-specific restriction protein A